MADEEGEHELNVEVVTGEEEEGGANNRSYSNESATLDDVLRRFVADVYSSSEQGPLFQRIKSFLSQNLPLLPEASTNTARNLLLWARHGTPLRALLLASVGTIGVMTLTGLLVFMIFFLAATVNAIVISLLMCLAAAGGFLAMFFTCLVAIYLGALTIAAFVISAATFSALIAALFVTGWLGFFFVVWMIAMKSIDLTKHSLATAGLAISSRSIASQAHHD
ncbi:uncharacterized protein LOC124927245 [Impatiens glandulifera]|uniref:uncharacterized protein LOC124927245 n=1 Tax=Impatiens glandulifera TaxID=253017 RepID=UPI001FB1653F|nr:uncharacterized protein LOC124927245 [Impatiens glandulifera]